MSRRLASFSLVMLLVCCFLATSQSCFAAVSLGLEEMNLLRGGYRCKSRICGRVSTTCDQDDGGGCEPGVPGLNCLNVQVTIQSVNECSIYQTGTICNPGPTTACGHWWQCDCNLKTLACLTPEDGRYTYWPCN